MVSQLILKNYTYLVEDLIKFIIFEDTPLLESQKGYTVVAIAVFVLITGHNLKKIVCKCNKSPNDGHPSRGRGQAFLGFSMGSKDQISFANKVIE